VRPRVLAAAAAALAATLLAVPAAPPRATALAAGFVADGAATPGTGSVESPRPAAAAAPVLPPLSAVPAPAKAGVRAVLDPLLRDAALGGDPGATVLDGGTGQLLYQNDAGGPRTPASVAKLLTAALVLTSGSGDGRLVTRVVRGAARGDLVLVGGGDPTLTARRTASSAYPGAARLADLADAVARTLRAENVTSVRLRVDGNAYDGPSVSPDWEDGYVPGGIVAPVQALTVDEGRVQPGADARVPDPAVDAGRKLAAMLADRGVGTTGPVRRGRAPAVDTAGEEDPAAPGTADSATAPPAPAPWEAGAELSRVESPTLRVLVEQMLRTSDNDLAEALARHGARAAGEPASFAGIPAAAIKALGRLGLPTRGVRMLDGSGLARGSTLPPATLAALLAAAASPEHPELRPLLSGLPVAGFTGTLADRFATRPTRRAAGEVRAKTGTLTGVTSLAGTAYDASGRLLFFVVMADGVPVGATVDAREAQDRIAAAVAACGCG
jgi:D-alanyl-D-alanine carboxypeptidase/D-alanyl-D-alanine-endopeptidase (penicillin-binding protein 4)